MPKRQHWDTEARAIFDYANQELGYDEDPIGVTAWWGEENDEIYIDGKTPLRALVEGRLLRYHIDLQVSLDRKGMD